MRKQGPGESSGLSLPPTALGKAPDVGSEIQHFLLCLRAMLVLAGQVSSFHLTVLQLWK